jgi:hypothetical protein
MKDLPDRSELVADPAPVAGGYTALRVRVTLGTELAAGERLAVFCPYGFTLPQVTRPRAPGFTTASDSGGTELSLAALPLSEQFEYERAVTVRPRGGPSSPSDIPSPAEAGSAKAGAAGGLRRTGGALPAGRTVEVVFGDRSKGSPAACCRLRGDERHFPRLPGCPAVAVSAGPAVLVRGFATPVLGRGEKGRLKLTAEDRLGNRARDFAGSVRLLGVEGLEGLPAEMRFAPADAGCKELDFTAAAEGVHHPVVSALGTDLEAGPVEVGARAPEYRLFFGELHCHTEHSYDAFGTLDEFYGHARRTAGLDFAAATDHMTFATGRPGYAEHPACDPDYPFEEFPARWRAIAEAARRHHEPGEFVTFLGVEADSVGHAGHRNVYFMNDDEPPVRLPAWPPPAGFLAEWVRGRNVLVIPHHPPIGWGPGIFRDRKGLVYGELPDEVQPAVEIYSRHGGSEHLDCRRPLRGQIPGHFVRDFLAAGHRFGFIAGSDSHQCNPGTSRQEGGPFKTLQYRSGLAAVWARALTREAIWEAIFARRCYATTYPRFVLRFRVNDLFMGQAGAAEWPRRVRIELSSPVDINEIEIVRNNEVVHIFPPTGHPPMPAEPEGVFEFVDEKPTGRAEDFYYVRVTSRSDERAWASPVFAKNA